MADSRCTLAVPVTIKGIGLHSGERTSVCLMPAPPGQGIVFSRVDLPGKPAIRASTEVVTESDRRTAIGAGDTAVGTVEHLLAALYAFGVDDLTIEVDGPEPPIGDGSASIYFEALECAEIREHECRREIIRIGAPQTVVEGDARYDVTPLDGLRVSITIEWDHPNIGRQSGCYDITRETFGESLARARTFGFKDEVYELHARGLAKGASESTVIVLTEAGIIGPSLRWPDEFVRHKTVDLLGDLALLGVRIEGEIVAFRPNHKGNIALARFIERTASMDVLQ